MVSPSITRSACAGAGLREDWRDSQPREDREGDDVRPPMRHAASRAYAVESFDVPCVAPGLVATDVRGFFHEAPAVGAGHMDHHRDAVDHAPARDVPRKIAAALHGAARQARQGALGVVRVDGGERTAVAGVEGLQQVGRFAAAHFADDDVIGAVPQGVPHQVADRNGALLQPARLEPDAVRGVDPQLQGILDGDDPLVVRDEGNEGIEERRLAAPGAAAHQNVAAGVEGPLGRVPDVFGQRALLHQLRRRKGSLSRTAAW